MNNQEALDRIEKLERRVESTRTNLTITIIAIMVLIAKVL